MTKRIASSPEKIAKKIIEDGEKKTKAKQRKEKITIGAEARERYKKRKHIVRALENDNHSKIIAFASVGEKGFWKLIGNSAIYYAFHEAKRLKKTVGLHRDTDFFDKDKNGFVAIRNIDLFEEELKELDVRITAEVDDPYVKVFDTGVKFTDADLKTMLRRNELLQKQMNEMIVPEVSDPDLYRVLRRIMELAVECHRTTDITLRDLTMAKIVEPAFHAEGKYILMARNNASISDTKTAIKIDMEKILVGVMILRNMNKWNIAKAWEISDLAAKAEVLLKNLGTKGNGNSIKK